MPSAVVPEGSPRRKTMELSLNEPQSDPTNAAPSGLAVAGEASCRAPVAKPPKARRARNGIPSGPGELLLAWRAARSKISTGTAAPGTRRSAGEARAASSASRARRKAAPAPRLRKIKTIHLAKLGRYVSAACPRGQRRRRARGGGIPGQGANSCEDGCDVVAAAPPVLRRGSSSQRGTCPNLISDPPIGKYRPTNRTAQILSIDRASKSALKFVGRCARRKTEAELQSPRAPPPPLHPLRREA